MKQTHSSFPPPTTMASVAPMPRNYAASVALGPSGGRRASDGGALRRMVYDVASPLPDRSPTATLQSLGLHGRRPIRRVFPICVPHASHKYCAPNSSQTQHRGGNTTSKTAPTPTRTCERINPIIDAQVAGLLIGQNTPRPAEVEFPSCWIAAGDLGKLGCSGTRQAMRPTAAPG
jgi:hypothetical protein